MSAVDLLRRHTVDRAAQALELHPFDVVRILVADDALPPDLRLDASHLERVRQRGGLEQWWVSPPPPPPGEGRAQALVRAMLERMIERAVVEPRRTRADNLFRGLDPEGQVVLRRAVNILIRDQLFTSHMATEGLMVALTPEAADRVRAAAGGPLSLLDPILERL